MSPQLADHARTEESDFHDDSRVDMPRDGVTMRELYQLLRTQSAQRSALQRQQNTGRSSSVLSLQSPNPLPSALSASKLVKRISNITGRCPPRDYFIILFFTFRQMEREVVETPQFE